ncbi:MAG: hypothetical protein AB7F86_03015 [Bdellovibrionales bacterium]
MSSIAATTTPATPVGKVRLGIFTWESLSVGGLSTILLILAWLLTERRQDYYWPTQVAFILAFLVNFPHFFASYALLYQDHRDLIFKRARYFWAGVLAPGIMVGIFYFIWRGLRAELLPPVIISMFFLVGWHYIKQTFGCFVVCSARRGFYLAKIERQMLLIQLHAIWMLSFTRHLSRPGVQVFYGVTYTPPTLPKYLVHVSAIVLAISSAAFVGLLFRRFIKAREWPPFPALIAVIAMHTWYIPVFHFDVFSAFIPLFHSLQYLYFVGLYKESQTRGMADDPRLLYLTAFFLGTMAVGALGFYYLPNFIDKHFGTPNPWTGPTLALALFNLFINIHHYFIDNAIWRADNELVSKHLFNNRA